MRICNAERHFGCQTGFAEGPRLIKFDKHRIARPVLALFCRENGMMNRNCVTAASSMTICTCRRISRS